MDKTELAERLRAAGVREDAYWLGGGLPSECHTLEAREGGWAVYYSQRGERSDERVFATESEACAELHRRVMEDRATR